MKVHCGQTLKTNLSKSTSEALFWMSRFRFLNKRGLNHEYHRVIRAFRSNCVTAFWAGTVILRLVIIKAAHALSGRLNHLGTNLNWELSITCSIWPGSEGSPCPIFKRTLVLLNIGFSTLGYCRDITEQLDGHLGRRDLKSDDIIIL